MEPARGKRAPSLGTEVEDYFLKRRRTARAARPIPMTAMLAGSGTTLVSLSCQSCQSFQFQSPQSQPCQLCQPCLFPFAKAASDFAVEASPSVYIFATGSVEPAGPSNTASSEAGDVKFSWNRLNSLCTFPFESAVMVANTGLLIAAPTGNVKLRQKRVCMS